MYCIRSYYGSYHFQSITYDLKKWVLHLAMRMCLNEEYRGSAFTRPAPPRTPGGVAP
jgi:hypothetical protein